MPAVDATPHSRREFLGACAAVAAGGVMAEALAADGRPATINGLDDADATRVREVLEAFLNKHDVPGISLAIARDGALKTTCTLGYADVESKTPVRPRHQFRIASVSKPITAIGILKRVEAGDLTLDHRVFAANGLLRRYYDPRSISPVGRQRAEAITLQHLLEHTCGGWGNSRNDPMFAEPALALGHEELIRWTLNTIPLEHQPGEAYSYSNFGYCLLGRTLEAVTGTPYDAYIRREVLLPAGIFRMRLGTRERHPDDPDEVTYYTREGDGGAYSEYMNVARMDAHGGWVASATDLVRLALRVDGFPNPADLLTEASLRVMTTPSKANNRYAKGWSVNEADNWWHTGSFNGGSSILVRTHDGFCWSALVNTRRMSSDYSADLDALMWSVRRAVQNWPKDDLFGSAE